MVNFTAAGELSLELSTELSRHYMSLLVSDSEQYIPFSTPPHKVREGCTFHEVVSEHKADRETQGTLCLRVSRPDLFI